MSIVRRSPGVGAADRFCDCDERNPHLCANADGGLCACDCHPRTRSGRPVLDVMEVLRARLSAKEAP